MAEYNFFNNISLLLVILPAETNNHYRLNQNYCSEQFPM